MNFLKAFFKFLFENKNQDQNQTAIAGQAAGQNISAATPGVDLGSNNPNIQPAATIEEIYAALEHGVQHVIAPTTEELLKVSGVDLSQFPDICPDGDWTPFITDFEAQFDQYFDTFGCNIFSGAHGLEMYGNAAFPKDPNYTINGKWDLSERAACLVCALQPRMGSSENQYEYGISNGGVVRQDYCEFPPSMTMDQFFSPLDQSVVTQAKKFLDFYTPQYANISTDKDSLRAALKKGTVKLFLGTGSGWNQGAPNIVPATNNPMGHAVILRAIDNMGHYLIFDQYAPYLKILASDYIIYYAFLEVLTAKVPQIKYVKHNEQFWQINPDGSETVVTDNAILEQLYFGKMPFEDRGFN